MMEDARCHLTRKQREVNICHTYHSSLNMSPKKTAKQKGATKKAIRCASPDASSVVSEPEPLSETGDVSNHETRQVT